MKENVITEVNIGGGQIFFFHCQEMFFLFFKNVLFKVYFVV